MSVSHENGSFSFAGKVKRIENVCMIMHLEPLELL